MISFAAMLLPFFAHDYAASYSELGSKDKAKAEVVEPKVRVEVVAVRNTTALWAEAPAAAAQNADTTRRSTFWIRF